MRRKLVTFLLVITMTLGLAACGQDKAGTTGAKDDAAGQNADVEETVEADTDIDTEDEKEEDADVSGTEASAETEREIELVAYDMDLSVFGEFTDKFFVLTNDMSQMATKDEVYAYIEENGYSLYPYTSADLDNTISAEESYEKGKLYIKPEFILDYCESPKYSYAAVIFEENKVTTIQYNWSDCTEEFVNNTRNEINAAIDSGIFDACEIEIRYVGEKENWTQIYIDFSGEGRNPHFTSEFANIFISLDTVSSLATFTLY